MRSVVVAHVDEFGGTSHALESGFHNSFRLAHESNHRAVGGFARVDIEYFHAAGSADCLADTVDNPAVASLAEIGHALDYSLFHGMLFYGLSGKDNAIASLFSSFVVIFSMIPRLY